MNIKLKLISATLVAIAILIAGFVVAISHTEPSPALGLVQDSTFDSANMTSTVFNVGVVPVALFKLGNIIPVGTGIGNANRHFGQVELTGAGPIFCVMNSTSTGLSSTNYGFELISTSTQPIWGIDGFQGAGGGTYDGQVYCESGSGTSTVAVEESN